MNFTSFDLNLLRVLDALLRDRSTTRAGERIGLSQPAVSAALGRLRHALGDPLFVRKGQGLEPTDFATSLAGPLEEALNGLQTMLGPAPFSPARSKAIFRIAGSDFFADFLFPPLARILAKEAPGIRVQMVDLVPDTYVGTLDAHDVDIALLPADRLPTWAESELVFRSGFDVVARDGHPRLARAGVEPGEVIPLDLFCDLGHVLMSPEGKLTSIGDAALAKRGRTRRVMMTMPFFSGVRRAVAESDLVALIPSQMAAEAERNPHSGLRRYVAPVDLQAVDILMVWHRRSSANAAHRWMRERIAGVLRPLDG